MCLQKPVFYVFVWMGRRGATYTHTLLRVLPVPFCCVSFYLLKQSVENCVCILNNLTFQLEAEAPALFSRITALAKPVGRGDSQGDAGPIGCFSPQSKSLVHEVRRGRCTTWDQRTCTSGILLIMTPHQTCLDSVCFVCALALVLFLSVTCLVTRTTWQ